MKFFIIIIVFFIPFLVFGSDSEMNGIKFNDYLGFQNKWKLITVRYRQDSGELRFIYGNEKAYATLKNKSKKFPEGAVLAKIGMATEHDHAFESSVLPARISRFQFMIKNSKRYPEAKGWGYALFGGNGKVMRDSASQRPDACIACHSIVPERDYVFSSLADFNPAKNELINSGKGQAAINKLDFELLSKNKIPNIIFPFFKQYHLSEVRSLTNSVLVDTLFIGTLNEFIPTLLKEAGISKKATLLINKNQDSFSLAIPSNNSECKLGEKKGIKIVSIIKRKEIQGALVQEYCWNNDMLANMAMVMPAPVASGANKTQFSNMSSAQIDQSLKAVKAQRAKTSSKDMIKKIDDVIKSLEQEKAVRLKK